VPSPWGSLLEEAVRDVCCVSGSSSIVLCKFSRVSYVGIEW